MSLGPLPIRIVEGGTERNDDGNDDPVEGALVHDIDVVVEVDAEQSRRRFLRLETVGEVT